MNGLPRHPGTEEIAEYQAGVTDGAQDDVGAHLAECADCASLSTRLARIPLIIASVPPPSLPSGLEARIMAALAAEGEARDLGRTPGDATVSHLVPRAPADVTRNGLSQNGVSRNSAVPGRRVFSPPAGGTGGRPAAESASPAWLRQNLIAPLGVLVAAAACLILAFVGLRLSAQSHPSAASASGRGPARAGGHSVSGAVTGPRQNSTSPELRQSGAFPVLVSSTNFRSATLVSQVRDQLTAAASGDSRISPSPSLVGCVARLAAGARLALVEEATYQSHPAYVIVIPGHAWVVARTCTRADPSVMASVALSTGR